MRFRTLTVMLHCLLDRISKEKYSFAGFTRPEQLNFNVRVRQLVLQIPVVVN